MDITEAIQRLPHSHRIEFSAVSGYNYYRLPSDEIDPDGIPALHSSSGSIVYLLPIAEGNQEAIQALIRQYSPFLYHPVSAQYFEWPMDLVDQRRENGNYVLYNVFPQRAFPGFVPIRQLLYQPKYNDILDWRNPQIAAFCRSFLTELELFNQAGYSYNNFNINRILYQEKTMRLKFRYSSQIRWIDPKLRQPVNPDKIAPEFAPAWLYREIPQKYPDAVIDHYSIAAILFRLMIGRLPYEGKGLANFGDVFDTDRDKDALQHQNYFRHYHEYPVFIFDRTNHDNRLGPMSENDLPRERWEKLHPKLQNMFCQTLSKTAAECLPKGIFYSAKQWLEACEEYCWNEKGTREVT